MTAYISRGAPVDALFKTAELLEDDRLFILSNDNGQLALSQIRSGSQVTGFIVFV